MLATAAAAALISCSKESNSIDEAKTPGMKTITIITGVQTRTTLDASHENLVWSTGDKISVFNDQDNTNSSLTYAPGGYMTIEVPAGTSEVYGHYPYYNGNTSGPSAVSIYISKSQTQKNPGELAGNYYPMVAKGTVTADNKANMVFYPVASALALNIYHTGVVGTEKVSKVVVTPSANTRFTGSQSTDITANNVTYTSAASSDPITVTLTNALTLGSTKPADAQAFDGQIYVCLAKQSYAEVQFEITTTKGVYTITSNTTPFDCVNNDFVPVNINLNAAAFVPNDYPDEPTSGDCWYRVERPEWLAAGDRVVIVNHDGTQVLGNVQKSNNRDGVAVSISTVGDYKRLTTNDNMQVFIVEEGTVNDSYAFWCENGDEPSKYMYAASSSNNYLKFQENKNDNASFIPTIVHGLGYLTAQGSNTRNVLRYNNAGTSNLFSCYAGITNNDISIYKYYGTWAGSTTCADPTITQEANTVTISCTTPGVKIYYTVNGDNPTTESTLYTAPINLAESVTVKAIATRSHYTSSGVVSMACTVKVATPVISSSANAFTITCATEGATIYYEISTTDLASVATPTTSSASYSASVSYTETTYVKAYAVKAGYDDSEIASATCTYSSGGGSEKTYTITWNSTNNSNGVGSYTASWSVTADGITCNMQNFNNNNNGWEFVKCGRKNNTSIATIITDSAISEAIKTVTLTIDAITAAKINSIKLYSSSNGESWTEEGSFTKETGDKSVTISSPTTDRYYKLEFDCASGSSNGLVTVSKLVFSTK